MRGTKAACMFGVAMMLASVSAAASDTPKGQAPLGKGGKGASPSEASPEATPTDEETRYERRYETPANKKEEEKPWEIGVSFETHRLIRQEDVGGQQKLGNLFGINALYSFTPRDSVGIREYITEGFVADNGETGVRAEDISAFYSHVQPLKSDFVFTSTFSISAPTSLGAQKEGKILSPSLGFGLDKRIGYFSAGLHLYGTYVFTKYREAEGGAPNPQAQVGVTANAEMAMPFLEQLAIGVSVQTGYLWMQNPYGQTWLPATQDQTYLNQPVGQSYGGEIFARYILPTIGGIRSDFAIALSQGDSNVGFTSYLHDGVGYLDLFYRQNSDVYAALTARY